MNERNKAEWICSEVCGFHTAFTYDKWSLAIIRHSAQFDWNAPAVYGRHLETDEAFVLLSGNAVMTEAGNGNQPTEPKGTALQMQQICVIPRGVWHQLRLSEDACVLVAENSNTSAANSEKYRTEEA